MAAGKTFYDILGVSKSASDKEIKSAFRKLAQKSIASMSRAMSRPMRATAPRLPTH